MGITKTGIIVWLITVYLTNIQSQNIENPNYGLKSHETLEIKKIEMNSGKNSCFTDY